ncbi:MAG TPA: hypothetical protein VHJ37_02720 [Thermoleophilaceae bacterium]|jgi:hypothetical protein|nr:hypothetical protein [Thermoleophilaceae bacterium]
MKVFLSDLWLDLREKRLWPVAVALLLGLVAVPVLLAKPAEDPGPPPAAVAPAQKAQAADKELAEIARVELGDTDGGGSGSTLGVFDPSDPFRPPSKVIKKAEEDEAGADVGGLVLVPESTGAGGASAGGGETDSGGGSYTGGGDTGGGETGGGQTPDSGGQTTTTTYKYVADVTFSANGRTRKIKGLEKLDMLPSQAAPLLIFMGVTAEGGNAVFLVDSTLDAAGEGRCKPSPSDCAFAYIGAGSEHIFTDEDGDSYALRIDEIRKVKVSPKAKRARAGKASGARANAAVGASRRFAVPLVADLVIEAHQSLDDRNPDTDSR